MFFNPNAIVIIVWVLHQRGAWIRGRNIPGITDDEEA